MYKYFSGPDLGRRWDFKISPLCIKLISNSILKYTHRVCHVLNVSTICWAVDIQRENLNSKLVLSQTTALVWPLIDGYIKFIQ